MSYGSTPILWESTQNSAGCALAGVPVRATVAAAASVTSSEVMPGYASGAVFPRNAMSSRGLLAAADPLWGDLDALRHAALESLL